MKIQKIHRVKERWRSYPQDAAYESLKAGLLDDDVMANVTLCALLNAAFEEGPGWQAVVSVLAKDLVQHALDYDASREMEE
jgi:hypothetical protein